MAVPYLKGASCREGETVCKRHESTDKERYRDKNTSLFTGVKEVFLCLVVGTRCLCALSLYLYIVPVFVCLFCLVWLVRLAMYLASG